MARRDDDDDDDDRYGSEPSRRRSRRDDDDDWSGSSSSSRWSRDDDEDGDYYGAIRRRRTEDHASKLTAPALCMIIVSLISFLSWALYCPFNLYVVFNNPERQFKRDEEKVGEFIGAGVVVPLIALSSLATGIGGILMKTRTSYAGAMIGAVVACIPGCSPCCIVGIPFGVWALMTLNDPGVKAVFRES
jgi:hypothetical protein